MREIAPPVMLDVEASVVSDCREASVPNITPAFCAAPTGSMVKVHKAEDSVISVTDRLAMIGVIGGCLSSSQPKQSRVKIIIET